MLLQCWLVNDQILALYMLNIISILSYLKIVFTFNKMLIFLKKGLYQIPE